MIGGLIASAVFLALVIGWRLESFEGLPGVRGVQRVCAWTFMLCSVLSGPAAAAGATRFVHAVASEIQADLKPIVDSMLDDLVPSPAVPSESP